MSSTRSSGRGVRLALSWIATGAVALSATGPAFAADTNAFGRRAGEFSLENAYRLPAILVTDLTATRDGSTVEGTFGVHNGETSSIGGLQYHLEAWGTGASDGTLFLREPVRRPFALSGQETKDIPFSFDISSLPAGDYVVRAQVVTESGRQLGWSDAPVNVEAGAPAFLETFATGETSPEWSGSLDPQSGPNVSPAGTVTLHTLVRNPTDALMTVIPTVRVSVFDLARGVEETLTYPAVTVAAGASRNLEIPVNVSENPEVYSALLSFTDAATKATVSPLESYRWVVKGADADVFPVQLQTLGTEAGEQVIAKIDVVGAADALTTSAATATVQVLDARGVAGEMTTPSLPLTDTIQSGVASVTLARDLIGPASIRVTMTDDEGAVLADHREALAATTGMGFAVPLGIALLALAVLAGVALLVQFLGAPRRLSLRHALPGSLAAGLTCLMLTAQLGQAIGAGNGNGIEVFTPIDGHNWHQLPGDAVIALFVNAPVHNANVGTYQKTNVPLQYRVSFGVCQNRVSYARVIGRFDANGGKQTTLAGANANWQVVHDKTFTAGPACPAGSPVGPDGAQVCHYNMDFNGSVNFANLSPNACSTTLQLVGKLGQSGLDVNAGLPGPPTASLDPATDPSFKYGQVHALNLWVNFCDGQTKNQCSDGTDNDGDGRIDANDPGCYRNGQYDPSDNDESNPAQCADGVDNDGDGASDMNDFSCSGPTDDDETNPKAACQDGIDNDNDGKTDFPQDPGCAGTQDNDEFNAASSSSSSVTNAPACSDGRDNDNDGRTDYQDPGCYQNGFYNPSDNDEFDGQQSSSSSSVSSAPRPQCSDGSDNDHDGATDAQDPGCYMNGFYDPNDDTEYNAGPHSSSSSSMMSSSSSYNPCGWYGCQSSSSSRSSSSRSSQHSSYNPCGWYGCQSSSSSQHSSVSSGCGWWCGWGWGTWNWNQNANTTVNNQVNAGSQNNVNIWQSGNGTQNADVNANANTTVNNQVNAGAQNNGWVW